MPKGRGKGKISNDLVAASCAAVLAVYAAGYSRTREATRRFEIHARVRRPAPPAVPATPGARAAVIEASTPQLAPGYQANGATALAIKPATKPPPSVAAQKPAHE